MSKPTPIARHFTRLRSLLSNQQVDELEQEYKTDLRRYERESRQRQRARQAQRRMARAGGQKGKSGDA